MRRGIGNQLNWTLCAEKEEVSACGKRRGVMHKTMSMDSDCAMKTNNAGACAMYMSVHCVCKDA